MPETARILKFPDRRKLGPLSENDAAAAAVRFLETDSANRNLGDLSVDVLFAISALLREKAEISPASVFEDAASLYRWILNAADQIGFFDEQEYLLGEFALLAGRCGRQLGRLSESELWLDRADSAFRHTVNAGPVLANVAFARLALRFACRRYADVLELIPSVIKSFKTFEMSAEVAKCEYLHAMSLKEVGRAEEYVEKLKLLANNPGAGKEPAVLGQTLLEIGEHHASEDRFDEAMVFYQKALAVLARANRPMALAHLKWSIGESFRKQNRLKEALVALKESQGDFSALVMTNYAVSLSLVVAETLLAMDRHREAEWEILAALPIIEQQKLVPEGLAAVALLKESVQRRKTDSNALREVRAHLQANQ